MVVRLRKDLLLSTSFGTSFETIRTTSNGGCKSVFRAEPIQNNKELHLYSVHL